MKTMIVYKINDNSQTHGSLKLDDKNYHDDCTEEGRDEERRRE